MPTPTRIARIVLLAVGVEALTILTLVLLVAVSGPADPSAAQEYAARLGRWVGPIAGFVLCLIGGWLAARDAVTGHVGHGRYVIRRGGDPDDLAVEGAPAGAGVALGR